MNINSYSALFIFSFIATTILTYILTKYLPTIGLVDVPSNRRSHNKITPRGGGLAIVIVVMIALSGFEYIMSHNLVNSIKILPLLLVIASISFLDDLKAVPILIRLIVHLICAACAILFFSQINSHILIHNILIIALSGFINIYNFMDGIDGMSCVESIHLSSTMLVLCFLQFSIIDNPYFIASVNVIILGCSCGFLIFNWHPAKIFLGDVGSISLGFLTGLCLLLLALTSTNLFIACVIASLYYMTDAVLTILIRLLNKEKIWQPHLKHFFQKAVQKGKSHKQVVSIIAICNIFLMIISVISLNFPVISIMLAIAVITLTMHSLLK
ncbi:undecaprenyl-phosphate alpha-N-acetylglucosaminyltransferase (mraY2) [Rickettsia prowazekii str. GvV257]|uniref:UNDECAPRENYL-PHOSPHATE ALPHA-N-ACETYLGLUCOSAMINYLTRANSFERASE (MraY2) n=2 Tax=Rickettsia prowazekii TaxID=782 RepID=Q9ZCD2_RICPR|nr:glycosyltransferase family 4 protein [Rickettsia prowazekii]ADE30399.1 Undecaprenyl-phosphate alpha-N-acetylglucosaminyl transferase [Rickettsia prowazekii str. Rp22]AFE49620.1 undecaprenyl-phosphate alpha-N-acetylglucosaminyltransferase (mraY2) [Rickettsia prowazekii str. Chernikova]AFE50464.1 undecaprenyl-phosphate alpha-N-acetylglucosaminyltransferase (mraY2) [Rickettsia prowazekii str. Katsinyian]AFE51307.1 undecaprenyl-phosphate alpha-N-acetylglucosaminyltransferase (mraY2) [Rickettsia 